jgi:Tol biopolymer transport system component
MVASEPERPDERSAEDRLGSWKAIAAYLKRDVTTVQRWERREGMPVHRHVHEKRGSVYAFPAELDAWLKNRRVPLDGEPRRRRLWWIGVAAVSAFAVAIVIALWLTQERAGPSNPLANARISPLTDFDGVETAAALSRDGKLVAFLSDRDGQWDAWVARVGTGEFHNLTKGSAPELLNPEIRSVAFTPDSSLVTLWTRQGDAADAVNVWAVPVMGGSLFEYRAGAVEMDWSSDGRRVVFHTTEPGDPTFVVEPEQSAPRQIHVGQKGVHNHFQLWSPDDRYIYFVQGVPPHEMDIWRVTPAGEDLQRITFHNSRVLYPVFLDARTLMYLATSDDGSGPWLYTVDVQSLTSRRISFGVEQYASLSASADRTRLVATVEHSKASLWRVPIKDDIAQETDAERLDIPTVGAFSPRLGPDYLLYVSAANDGHAIWKFANGTATELWSAPRTRVVGGPAISPDGKLIAFSAEDDRGTRVYVLDTARRHARALSESLDVRGAPTWSRDGRSIIVAVSEGGEPQLFSVPLDSGAPSPLVRGYSINPIRSTDGEILVYADADAGPEFPLKAITANGAEYRLPDIRLPRGTRRASWIPGRRALVVLQGEMRHNNFWYIDLDTGARRQLTDFGREFTIRDFEVSADGRVIVFDRRQENSDLALIEIGMK